MPPENFEELYRLLVENVEEYAIITFDVEGQIVTWSVGAERIFGYTKDEAIGLSSAVVFTDEDRMHAVPDQELETARQRGQAHDERWHVRKGGARFWGRGTMTALYDEEGRLRGYAKVMRDNTDLKRWDEELHRLNETLEERVRERTEHIRRLNATLEERVRERTEQVRDLASSLARAERSERQRIAQLLHEDVQQLLYGAKMQLEIVHEEADTLERARIRERVATVRDWLDRAIHLARRLTVDLSPPLLSEDGIVEAFRWLEGQMRDLYGFQLEISADGPISAPDEDLRQILFQSVRELLFNTVKHAGTRRATVEVSEDRNAPEGPQLVVRVSDLGSGFDVREAERKGPSGSGTGLLRLRERIVLAGGHMEIFSRPGEGTRVTIRMPLGPRELPPLRAA